MKALRVCVFAVAIAAAGAGCRFAGRGGVYQRLLDRHQTVERLIGDEERMLANDLATSRVPRIAEIAAREDIQWSFAQAAELLAGGRGCMTIEFLDEDDAGETGGATCEALVDRAEAAARAPRQIVAAWTRLWQDAPDRAARIASEVTAARSTLDAVLAEGSDLLATVEAKAQVYPFKRADLERRVTALRALPGELGAKQAEVAAQVTANTAATGDIAELQRSLESAGAAIARAQASVPDLKSRVGQLADDEHTLVVRLQKTTFGSASTFLASMRTVRNGVASPDAAVVIDAATFARYLILALGVQQVLPDAVVVKQRPLPTVLAMCAPEFALDVELVIAQKEPGQYTDETASSPSPAAIPLGLVGDTSYGSWQPGSGGDSTWQFDAAWAGRHPAVMTVPRELYARYSAWRFDGGFTCGFERDGNRVNGPGACDARRADALVANVLAICAPEPDPYRQGTMTVRGAGRHTRSRGMGGGGK